MKKKVAIIIALLAVIAGTYLWFKTMTSSIPGETLLPPETVAYATLPDIVRTKMRWPATALGKISASPEVVDFAKKPLAFLLGEGGSEEAAAQLAEVRPVRMFAAIPAIEKGVPRIVLGFQYHGDLASCDAAITRLQNQLAGGDTRPTILTEDYRGIRIKAAVLGEDKYLYSATAGGWAFLSNNRLTLVGVLERLAGHDKSPALDTDPEFSSALKRMDKASDFRGFVRMEPVLDMLRKAAEEVEDIAADEESFAALKKITSFGYSVKLDGAHITDDLFVTMPSEGTLPSPIAHSPMDFTTNSTLGYLDFYVASHHLKGFLETLRRLRLTDRENRVMPVIVENAPEAFDGEFGLIFSWSADDLLPSFVAMAPLKNPEEVAGYINTEIARWTDVVTGEKDGARTFSFPQNNTLFSTPCVAITEDMLLGALQPDILSQALNPPVQSPDLTESEAFAGARMSYRSANIAFAFLDARGIFERSYPMLRQVLVFGSSFLGALDNVVDSAKVPSTETISRHLVPFIFSAVQEEEGISIKSSGIVPMNQIILGGAVWASATKEK